MVKNPLWIALYSILGLILIWYTVDTAWKWWTYESLQTLTKTERISFSVENEGSDRYFLKGSYSFSNGGRRYKGETVLKDRLFRNYLAAEEVIPQYLDQEWDVWYNLQNPEYSTLQKNFPFKECLYTVILWALFVYFIWIGWRISYGNHYFTK